MVSTRSLLFGLILSTYLIAGLLYATLTPQWQAPDEPAHYNYIRYLATETGFPELIPGCYDQSYLNELTSRRFPASLSIDALCYEFHQPPLYYMLATPIFILSNGSLIALRLLSVLLGAGTVALAFITIRTTLPENSAVAYSTMAFVAFVPMHVAILASVNNDALAELILAILLFLLVRRLLSIEIVPITQDLLLGLLLGVGLLTKTTVYIALPLVAVTLWIGRDRSASVPGKTDWQSLFRRAAIIFGLALAITSPWYMRNATVYGNFDILGLRRHDEIVIGQLRTIDFLTEVGPTTYANNFISTTFRSFWGQFGWMAVPMDGRTYFFLSLLTLIAFGGLIGLAINSSSTKVLTMATGPVYRNALAIILLALLLIVLGYGWYNLTFVQLQGRYLFPSLIPLAFFFSMGLYEALSQRRAWWLIGSLCVVLGWIIISSGLSGNLDKWTISIVGLALVVASGRLLFSRYWTQSTAWLIAFCYLGLSLLTLAGPFWFVSPNL